MNKAQPLTRGNKAWRVCADSTRSNLVRASARLDRFPLVNPPRPHTTNVVTYLSVKYLQIDCGRPPKNKT